MSTREPPLVGLSALGLAPYDGERLNAAVAEVASDWRLPQPKRARALLACRELVAVLDAVDGVTLQERYEAFELSVWPRWRAGVGRPPPRRWSWGVRAAAISRAVRPSWQGVLPFIQPLKWVKPLPADDPLVREQKRVRAAIAGLQWAKPDARHRSLTLALRILLGAGYASLDQITEEDLRRVASEHLPRGIDALDGALCALGVFKRTPKRGPTRLMRVSRVVLAELAARVDMPERFRDVTGRYLETYAQRISDNHSTLRNKASHLARFWRFIAEHHPEVAGCRDVLPAHARAYIPAAIAQGRAARRQAGGEKDTDTAAGWLSAVRVFFTDICSWATEPGSPFATYAPRTIPLTHHDLKGVGFEKVRRRKTARMTATVLELEREVPNIRAYAFRAWHEADAVLQARPGDRAAELREREAFWDWALLELLVQSGLRIEEACELTTLDVLKRHLPDGRRYYLLHVKPSKFDRVRVIPRRRPRARDRRHHRPRAPLLRQSGRARLRPLGRPRAPRAAARPLPAPGRPAPVGDQRRSRPQAPAPALRGGGCPPPRRLGARAEATRLPADLRL
ncbi:MAG: hypothetical protein M3401_00565 [Actinomycetota bacterium]|nr:hypothetical protein [Actinomycetota bacterium]